MKGNPNTFVILDQASGYLQLDILEAARKKYINRVIIAGTLVERSTKLDSNTIWEKIIPYDRSTTILRLSTWIIATLQMFWLVGSKYRKAHILAITNPPFSVFVPWLLGCKYDILMYDIYPDTLVRYNYLSSNNPVVQIWKWMNSKAFKKSNKVFTLSEGMRVIVSSYVSQDKIEIVPIWTDSDFITPIPKNKNKFLKEKSFNNKFLIIYSGNMGKTHPIEVLLELSKLLNPELFHIVLIGGGHKYNEIKSTLANGKAYNLTLLPWQPVDMLPHLLSASDISVVTLDNKASSLSVPSKTFNILSAGKPILAIAEKGSELTRLLNQYNCGNSFNPDELMEMKSWIEFLRKEPEEHQELAKNSLIASKYFTKANAEELV